MSLTTFFVLFIFFFFSSRRRHTRCSRDWSSDVCSSDLVWHPYGGFPAATEPLVVASATGVRLTLADGRELIDGMSSWWAAIHGYAHPVLDAAVTRQLGAMAHVMFGGLTHPTAVRLAELLIDVTPEPLTKVFFAHSGS